MTGPAGRITKQAPVDIRVVDDFYDDPEKIRNLALSWKFEKDASFPGFPGRRTRKALWNAEISSRLQELLRVRLSGAHKGNGCFQIIPRTQGGYIHIDSFLGWVGLVYLSPGHGSAPGTRFYRHRGTGLHRWPGSREALHYAYERGLSEESIEQVFSKEAAMPSRWQTVLTVQYRYNRMVLYRPDSFHNFASSWGRSPKTARLTQIFALKERG